MEDIALTASEISVAIPSGDQWMSSVAAEWAGQLPQVYSGILSTNAQYLGISVLILLSAIGLVQFFATKDQGRAWDEIKAMQLKLTQREKDLSDLAKKLREDNDKEINKVEKAITKKWKEESLEIKNKLEASICDARVGNANLSAEIARKNKEHGAEAFYLLQVLKFTMKEWAIAGEGDDILVDYPLMALLAALESLQTLTGKDDWIGEEEHEQLKVVLDKISDADKERVSLKKKIIKASQKYIDSKKPEKS